MVNIGLPQKRNGYTEFPLYTGGDALMNLLGSADDPHYDADDVLNYLYDHTPSLKQAMQEAAPADEPHSWGRNGFYKRKQFASLPL